MCGEACGQLIGGPPDKWAVFLLFVLIIGPPSDQSCVKKENNVSFVQREIIV